MWGTRRLLSWTWYFANSVKKHKLSSTMFCVTKEQRIHDGWWFPDLFVDYGTNGIDVKICLKFDFHLKWYHVRIIWQSWWITSRLKNFIHATFYLKTVYWVHNVLSSVLTMALRISVHEMYRNAGGVGRYIRNSTRLDFVLYIQKGIQTQL